MISLIVIVISYLIIHEHNRLTIGTQSIESDREWIYLFACFFVISKKIISIYLDQFFDSSSQIQIKLCN